MTPEETIDYIVQEMASGGTYNTEMGEECLYCDGEEGNYSRDEYAIKIGNYTERFFHKPDCVVLLARQVLREQGTPLKIYNITADFMYMKTLKAEHWKKGGGYTLAISEEVAIRNWSKPNRRNIKAEFIAVLPDQQKRKS